MAETLVTGPLRTSTMEERVMQPDAIEVSTGSLWAGRILGGFATLFLLMDGGMKVAKPAFVVEATMKLGYPEAAIAGIGMTLLACTLLYVIPRTSLLGALLLTGYLGGAVASNFRAGMGWFNTLFPVGFAGLIWISLWLRGHGVCVLTPLVSKKRSTLDLAKEGQMR